MRRRNFIRGAALASTAFAVPAMAAAGPEPVDLELVLAVDVSSSISAKEMELQFQGYAAAFRAESIGRRIGAGPVGAIACTLFVWSDADHQQVLIPWMRLDGPGAAQGFASAIEEAPRVTGLYTSISGAIDFAVRLFGRSPYEGARRVVDISGDGIDNAVRSGRTLAQARGDAIERGIVLNGLAILDTDPPPGSGSGRRMPPLDDYYRDSVIGGPGSFLVVAEGFEAFEPAVRRKLAREIARAPAPAAPLVERVSAA